MNKTSKIYLASTALEQKLDKYISEMKRVKKAVTITGFLVYANISWDEYGKYLKSPACSKAIKKLKLHAENSLVDKVINDNKPVGSIFLLKSKYNYVEANKLDITSNGETLGVIQLPTRGK